MSSVVTRSAARLRDHYGMADAFDSIQRGDKVHDIWGNAWYVLNRSVDSITIIKERKK